ncbi:Uncharacterized protein BM_BM17372 [Brugia malayi]|uniref:Uncharacterized protein n=1 Tax=Brugia malayi TaxID=6279 RepID=A0A4E9F4I8_BRUMA|nr:Uncharacterized protein BM_BM17372 [Brugia malayi]VIO90824.1 Uncharacterized protein BM_BM17372 [Brugia malayi]
MLRILEFHRESGFHDLLNCPKSTGNAINELYFNAFVVYWYQCED